MVGIVGTWWLVCTWCVVVWLVRGWCIVCACLVSMWRVVGVCLVGAWFARGSCARGVMLVRVSRTPSEMREMREVSEQPTWMSAIPKPTPTMMTL